MPRFSLAGWRPAARPWVWSQLTLAHNALVGLNDILYLIFKFAVTLRKSFAALTPWLGG
jgi:hypothetical protein